MKVTSEYVLHNMYFNALLDKGWELCDGSGGVITKNDCVLYDHSFAVDERVFVASMREDKGILHKPIRLQVNPGKCDWHLESLGWLLKRGFYNDRFTILDGSPELDELSAQFDEEINEIDRIAEMSDVERRSLKMKSVDVPKSVTVVKPVKDDSQIEEGSFIHVTRTVKNNSLMVEGAFYQLDFVTEEVAILKALNKRYRATGKSYQTDVTKFISFIQDGTIEHVDFRSVEETTYYKEWVPLGIGPSSDVLPDQLKNCVASDARKMLIATAYSQCQNFTALLNPGLKDSACENIVPILESNLDSSFLAVGYLSAAVCEKVTELAMDGYDLSTLPLDDIMYSDFVELLNEETARLHKFDELASDGYTLDQIRAIKNVSFFREDNSKLLNKEYAPNVIRLVAYLGRVNCPENVIDYFASQMLSEFEPYISKSFCDVELLSFVRRFFKNSRPLEITGVAWNEFVERFLEQSYFISFSAKRGLMLSNGSIAIGRDFNSYAIYRRSGEPIWRATLINNEFIVNRSRENEIII